jgi:hypothetical protein
MRQAEDEAARLFKGGEAGTGGGIALASGSGGGAALASGLGDGPVLSAPMVTVGSDGQVRRVDPSAVSGIVRAGEGGGQNAYYSEQAMNNRAVDRVLSGFDPEVRDIVKQSPTLANQLFEAERAGYTFEVGEAGDGSFHVGTSRRVVVEGGQSAEATVGTIAHEAGHGHYHLHEELTVPPQENMSRDVYVEINVEETMRNEGYAQFNAAKIRAEILNAGGPDIGMGGTQAEGYLANYQAYADGKISQEEAVMNNADLMGMEVGSNSKLNYLDNYREFYERQWNEYLLNQEGGAG